MKRAIVLLSSVALLLPLASPASAAPLKKSGTISFGNPVGKLYGGLTELFAPCKPSDTQWRGVDGWWVSLGTTRGGKKATLTSDAVDIDVYFYDSKCRLMLDQTNATSLADEIGPSESGKVPTGARFAIVDLIVGANSRFTLKVD